ncbi:efflux RND transporter periplasmic adaptor subunit [Carboxylicivirga sp. A043]|uniref:efflux RND transporter periplasmic adaptor subunit n=1 Tax=Carboxylicivirga litoralis TaxID=2816963 RepID=UPI0021CAE36D|nr:efflux RND transporter periplasmic adaptor subunit [Carboxylicivirga sp. A043]MCU4157266.1 efflux RND transporter periplasmic adaptor subunit [Carboxylicivirga sp. A043]
MKKITGLNFLLMGSLAFYGCQNKTEQKAAIRPVKVYSTISNYGIDNRTLIPATINEKRETKLAFRVKGPLMQLNDIIGDYVEQGQVIAQIDPRDYKIAVESTQATHKLAKAEYQRYKTLLEKESVAVSTYDQVESNYTSAKTAFTSAKNALADTELRAPFSGYISNVFVNNFEEVNPGQPIVSFIDLSKLEVKAWVSLNELNKINEQTQFTCLIDQNGIEIRIPATLKEIGHKTSASKQSYPVSVIIDNPDDINLRSGMSTHLEIAHHDTKASSSMQIPVTCLFNRADKTFVWLLNDGNTVSSKEIKRGRLLANDMIEVKSGLNGGEKLISTGVHYLSEGQKVKMYNGFSKTNIGNKL